MPSKGENRITAVHLATAQTCDTDLRPVLRLTAVAASPRSSDRNSGVRWWDFPHLRPPQEAFDEQNRCCHPASFNDRMIHLTTVETKGGKTRCDSFNNRRFFSKPPLCLFLDRSPGHSGKYPLRSTPGSHAGWATVFVGHLRSGLQHLLIPVIPEPGIPDR